MLRVQLQPLKSPMLGCLPDDRTLEAHADDLGQWATWELERVGLFYEGEAYVQRIVDHMSDEEIRQGLHFFKRISEIVAGFRQE